MNLLKKKIDNFPEAPGVYIMYNPADEIIYIGKAKSLKKRVSSYFQKRNHDIKTSVLVKKIKNIEFIITDTEIEALILESNLIKKHRPKFNVRLKDDKRYPYIAVSVSDDYPRVFLTRNIKNSKYRYFGPFTDSSAAKNMIAMINSIFKFRTCNKTIPFKKDERPCINYQIEKCSGACKKYISKEDYNILVNNAVKFLEGNIDPILINLTEQMNSYSESLQFEKAKRNRDIIFDIQKISQNQKVNIPYGIDQDYIEVEIENSEAILIIFEFRKGILLGRKIFIFENIEYSSKEEILKSFILDHYKKNEIPVKIITQYYLKDKNLLEIFLKELSSKNVKITLPSSPDDKGVINMILKNINVIAAERKASKIFDDKTEGLNEIKNILNLKRIPETIVCFDISNTLGENAVASMVSFKMGVPDKQSYRKFKIRGYHSPNDPGMIHEAVTRRVQHLINENIEFPDLIIIDGGKTQLSRAIEAASNFTDELKIISIAKRLEEIFYSPEKNSIILSERSQGLKIIKHLRDESHRFAITYHRKLRDKKMISSGLDNLSINNKTKSILLKKFKSIDNLKKLDKKSLLEIDGIGEKTAIKILTFLKKISHNHR